MESQPKHTLSELDDFLTKVGVENCDSSFDELKQFLAQGAVAQVERQKNQPNVRWQDSLIEQLVNPGESVLDVGCGEGDLMARLVDSKKMHVQGIEISEEMVLRCIERGLPVYHGDLEESLKNFCEASFDYVILEETLQTLQHPLEVLKDMLRVGRKCIISFPNFAHWSVRLALGLGGRMPCTKALPNTWYNTPNIHLCSINDFLDWTKQQSVIIRKGYVLVNGTVETYEEGHNLTAEQAMFIVEKND